VTAPYQPAGTSLIELQRSLADLLRGDPPRSDHPYLAAVAASTQLGVTREVVVWWRAFGVSRACPLTATLLRRLGAWDRFIVAFVRRVPISPYVEVLADRFLDYAAGCEEPLVASVAGFEQAFRDARHGRPAAVTIDWPCDPSAALLWLASPTAVPTLSAATGAWATRVGPHEPDLYRALRSDGPPGPPYVPGPVEPPAGLTPGPASGGSPRAARPA
jgi:hypothetical protein